ncbi:Uncharacterised protein [Legionella busanensis]|uniref:Uncharacterized protein n=1 Tax=Legionella busanensis TaxID=190655 RepID=A0A378JN61_9GAMM|nr:hypothetical protein [Legionella busanensis]STX52806.1 Uncharacterised protein [Legionella busanensis]
MPSRKEKLIQLAEDAFNTRIPSLNLQRDGGWEQSYYPVFGVKGPMALEKISKALMIDDTDPLCALAIKINKAISTLEQEQMNFVITLGEYRQAYESNNSPVTWLKPDDLAKNYKRAIAHLKEISKELREILLLQPTYAFLAVGDSKRIADPTNLHPAQEIFMDGAHFDELKYIVNSTTRLFNHKSHKCEEDQELAPEADPTSTSTPG